MGPQPFGCGRGACKSDRSRISSCFNGAATFRLRKADYSSNSPHPLRRFNGAATFRLRKGRHRRALWALFHFASMGPQPFGCGRRPPTPSRRQPRPELQWGRNLSVAEGSASAAFASSSPSLQWGRNLSVAEGQRRRDRRRQRFASMGPQPFGCGRQGPRAEHGRVDRASMGPQPFGCGRGNIDHAGAQAAVLQWGRNLSVAEGEAEAKAQALAAGASMGPQPFGCGRRPGREQGGAGASGFNGAATFRLRKAHARLAITARGTASMGPQPFGCGRSMIFRCARCENVRFNGAATFRLRKEKYLYMPGNL